MPATTDYTSILYAADGQPNVVWNALSGPHTPVVVTYSFVATADLASWEASSPYANDGYTSLTTAQRANFRDALVVYAQAAGIIFVEAASGHGMINVMDTSGSAWGGWAETPYTSDYYTSSGELIIDNTGDYNEGTYGFQTILHEMGHAMGLEHPWEGSITLAPSIDNQAHTVMTYNSGSPYTSHLGTLDIAAMQFQYGAASAVAGWTVQMVAHVVTVVGSLRADSILGAAGSNNLTGGEGADSLYGRQDNDTLHGGLGGDRLWGNLGSDKLYGEAGNDILFGNDAAAGWGAGDDSLYGGQGYDTLKGGTNDDQLFGGIGQDDLDSFGGNDILRGGAGSDRLYGGVASNSYGNQTFYGDGGNDVLNGGQGQDTLYGGLQNDSIKGDSGSDRLMGDAGNDTLDGGSGWDSLFGGDGADVFYGSGSGGSQDTFTGGAGADRFVFVAKDVGSNFVVTDFERGLDRMDCRALQVSFADVQVSGTWFHIGTLWVSTAMAAQLTANDFLF